MNLTFFKRVPRTFDEATQLLLSKLDADTVNVIRTTPFEHVDSLHDLIGLQIEKVICHNSTLLTANNQAVPISEAPVLMTMQLWLWLQLK